MDWLSGQATRQEWLLVGIIVFLVLVAPHVPRLGAQLARALAGEANDEEAEAAKANPAAEDAADDESA